MQLGNSTSNLLETLHGGRPKDEEPHVKKNAKKNSEKVDYIVSVDLVSGLSHISTGSFIHLLQESLGIDEDEFDDLQSLFQVRFSPSLAAV